MADYALLDEHGVVTAIVVWDGNVDTWQPPEGVKSWVDVSDPDLFVETGGRLDPDTLNFERGDPPVVPDGVGRAVAEIIPPVVQKLLGRLIEKGTLSSADVDELLNPPLI